MLDARNLITAKILDLFDLATFCDNVTIVETYVLPILYESHLSDMTLFVKLINFIHKQFQNISRPSRQRLMGCCFIPTDKSFKTRKAIIDLVDPESIVARSVLKSEIVFPAPDLKSCRSFLLDLGMVTDWTSAAVASRCKAYADNGWSEEVEDKCSKMLSSAAGTVISNSDGEVLRHLSWLPARMCSDKKSLQMPVDCRDHSVERLVNYTMPITTQALNTSWHLVFRWGGPIAIDKLRQQLVASAACNDRKTIEFCVDYIVKETIYPPVLFRNIAWIPTTSGNFLSAFNVFVSEANDLCEDIGNLDRHLLTDHKVFFQMLGVAKVPSFTTVRLLQSFIMIVIILTNVCSIKQYHTK